MRRPAVIILIILSASVLASVSATHVVGGGSGLAQSHGALTSARAHHAALYVSGGACTPGCVYVLAGGSQPFSPTSEIVRYDPADPDRDALLGAELLQGGRAGAGYALLYDRIYLFGGNNGDGWSNSIASYNVTTNSTTLIPVPTSVPNLYLGYEGIAAATLGDSIYLFGGCNNNGCTSDAWRYTPGAQTEWTSITPANAPIRGYMAAATDGARIYLAGGYAAGYQNDVYVQTYSSQVLLFDPASPSTLMALADLPAGVKSPSAFWAGKRLYVVGGFDGAAVTGAITRHDGASSATSVGSLPTPVANASIAFDGTRAYLVGGETVPSNCDQFSVCQSAISLVQAILPDLVAPTPAFAFSPSAPNGLDGWYTSEVTATLTATDTHEPTSALALSTSLDGASYASTNPRTLSDGTWTLYGRASDPSGNAGTTSVPIKVDTTPPTISIALAPATPNGIGLWYTSHPVATISTTSGDVVSSGFAYSADGQTYTSGQTFTFPDGTTTLIGRVRDPAGNTVTSTLGPVRVDTVAPTVTVSGSEGALAGSSASIAFTFSEAMDTSSTEAALAGASGWTRTWSNGNTVLTVSHADVPIGSHTLAVGTSARDAHGVALSTGASRTVERAAPPPPAPAPAPARPPPAPIALVGILNGTSVQLGWTPPDTDNGAAITGYRVYVDGALAAETASARHVVGPLARGVEHAFRVSAVNSAGEGAAVETRVAVPPSSTLVVPDAPASGWYAGAPTVAFTTDPASATILVDTGAGEAPLAGSLVLPPGETLLRWRAAVGEIREAVQERAFRIDPAPPAIDAASVSPMTLPAGTPIAISARVRDANSGVATVEAVIGALRLPMARGDDGAFHAVATPAAGTVDITIVARDVAGHEASAPAGTIVVSTAVDAPPTPPGATPSSGAPAGDAPLESLSTDTPTGDAGSSGNGSSGDAGGAPEDVEIVIEAPDGAQLDAAAGARGIVTVRIAGVHDIGSIFVVVVSDRGEETILSEGANETTWDTNAHEDGFYTIEARRRPPAPGEGEVTILSSHAKGETLASLQILVRNPAASPAAVAGAIVGGVLVAAAATAGLSAVSSGASSAASSSLGGFDPLGFAQEVAIDAGQDKLRDKTKDKAAIDRRRRIASWVAAGLSLALLAALWALADPEERTWRAWLAALPIVGAAAAIVTLLKFSAESGLAWVTHARPRIRLWVAGAISLAFSTIVLRNPFGYPGYVDETGESEARGAWRQQGIRALATVAGAAAFMLPFLALARVAPWGFVDVGILIAATNAATSAMPFGPLPGRDIWRWNKPLAIVVALAGLALYVVYATALAPLWALAAVGVVGFAAYATTLVGFRRTLGPKPRRIPVATPVPVNIGEERAMNERVRQKE